MRIYGKIDKGVAVRLQSTLDRVLSSMRVAYKVLRTGSSLDRFAAATYSQEGEDRILHSLFGVLNKANGFYVDVGAHHPIRFSNTHSLFMRGWSGINIDASHKSIALFEKMRPGDVNVALGVGERAGTSIFYTFDESALNTFDEKLARSVVDNTSYRIIEEQIIEVVPLFEILDKHMPKGREIDFLSVDVEGRDLDVLKSNDWLRYRPSYVLAEWHGGFSRKEGFSLEEAINSELTQFLGSKGYEPFAKTLNTLFFKFMRY